MESQEEKENSPPKSDKRFSLWYIGSSALDRRTTLPMLPWLVAEIRRKSEKNDSGPIQAREVQLVLIPPFIRCVPSNNANSSVFIFEHKAQLISRFIHNSNDLTYFAYLIRGQQDNPESQMSCHVFKACDPNQVSEVISSIRQVSKSTLKGDAKPKQETDEAFYNSQKYEVLYCGKVTVGQKKAPTTLVDDCIEKFRQHEVDRKRQRLLSGQRASADGCPVEFTVGGEGDPLSDVLNESLEDTDSLQTELLDVQGRSLSGSASQGSLRGGFPECILEDSGFEEQQEFRTRCSSLAGGVQRRPRETAMMAPARRRHASAPNHVQPSDADKNRTMLFQVGRFEVNLISPDSKSVVLEKNFKDISSCSQGIKQTDHFGFICRDPVESGPSQYVCFVFQCANESLVDEVMLTLKQAFSTAATLQSNKTPLQLCEACPMHGLHKLCERIEGLYPPKAKIGIQKYLSQMSENEQVDIFERVTKMKPSSEQEENEVVIIHLRTLCETKQKSHLHIGECPQNAPNSAAGDGAGGRFKLDILKNKARTSLTSSLENIFTRGASRMRDRLGSIGSMSSFDRQDEESPGHSPPAPASPSGFQDDDPGAEGLQFRRRAHTFSHPPVKKRISFEGPPANQGKHPPLRRQQSLAPELLQHSPAGVSRTRSVSESETSSFSLASSFSAPTFLKSFYQGSLGSLADSGSLKSNGEGRKRTLSACSNDSVGAAEVTTPRKVSWRQKIFLRVASPMNKPSASMQDPDPCEARDLLPLSPRLTPLGCQMSRSTSREGAPPGVCPRRTVADYRLLWRNAIHQQILLLRMEKENQKLEASRDELHIRKVKLDYQEVGPPSKEVLAQWEKRLTAPGRTTVLQCTDELHSALCQGVPKGRRGEVWLLLSHQHRLRHRLDQRQLFPPDTPYQDLLKQLTAQQHAILVDLGRTFPTHQYFSAQLGAGQLSLYNLLKAYSLLDTEVGYCQGVSFVAGILLLHMSEGQAFDMLKFLMYDLGFRRQYRPDMVSLQIQMYQLSRLLHDYHRRLYTHLEEQEIGPSLYAAPWFLTLFASQFPLGFVSRIFDFLFIRGTEVVFKVALCLLSSHEEEIMECDSFESIVDYLKTTIPSMTEAQMEQTIAKVSEMDISKQLHTYEVEYHVLQDEMVEGGPLAEDSERLDKLEKTNVQLKRQNMELLEKLQAARQKIQTLETNVESFLSRESKMKHAIRSLEQERTSYQKTAERMRSCLPADALADVEMTQIKMGPNGKAKPVAKKP